MLKTLRHGGSITFTKLNKARTLQKNEYKCNCKKCGTEYIVVSTPACHAGNASPILAGSVNYKSYNRSLTYIMLITLLYVYFIQRQ